ncbi:hypothetical protein AMTR_s04226p00004040, partial [Amborella trichopoda]
MSEVHKLFTSSYAVLAASGAKRAQQLYSSFGQPTLGQEESASTYGYISRLRQ